MTQISTLARTQVDMAGLMRLLANNLYTSPEVVVRELVQNAHDSCIRRQLEDTSTFTSSVRVLPDPAAGTLTIEDTGAGLTREEIDRFLATVGAGYTGQLRRSGSQAQLIGQFGIGFLSAYAVSEGVDLFTTSFKTPDESWHFSSVGGERYGVEEAPSKPVGTRVVLRLSEKFLFLADSRRLETLLRYYCRLLTVPVLAGSEETLVNEQPPWRNDELSPIRRRKLSLEMAAKFEHDFQPICTLDVTPSHGGSARGLLWIQDGGTYGTSDNRNVWVFVRGMLVSDDAKDLVPAWAGFVGGVLEADELSPTASREDVQKDAAFSAISTQIKETLVEGLSSLARNDPAAWRRILTRHNESLLGAALSDERLFDVLSDVLKVPTSSGDLTVPAVRARSKGKVHVSLGESAGAEEVLFRALGVPVVQGWRYGALPFVTLHRKGRNDVVRLGTDEGNAALFAPAQLDEATETRLRELFHVDGVELVLARFAPTSLPLVLMPDRDAELKERLERDEADKRIGSAALGLARVFTASLKTVAKARLYVNTDAPVLQSILAQPDARARPAARLLVSTCALMANTDALDAGLQAGAALEQLTGSLEALLAPSPTSA